VRRRATTHSFSFPIWRPQSVFVPFEFEFDLAQSVCVFGCASFMAAYWFHVAGGPKPNKQKTFYELVIVVVCHAFCVVHKVGFYCFVVAAVFGQLLIGSSKLHSVAFKLQLFAVRMAINIECCRALGLLYSAIHCGLAWPVWPGQSLDLSDGSLKGVQMRGKRSYLS